MSQSISRKRPWVAALLAALATGLGHLYLRRWRRALGWLVVLAITVLAVDPSGGADYWTLAPILFVGSLSVVDAYVIAHVQNAVEQVAATPADELTHCPNCGRELDADLEFCHWCTTTVGDVDGPQGGSDERIKH